MQQSFDWKNFIHLFCCCCCCLKRGFQRADGLGLGHQKLGGNFPSGASGTHRERKRERAISCRKARPRDGRHTHATSVPWPGLEPTSRSADGWSYVDGLAVVVVVVVVDAGEGQVQGDGVSLLSQVGAGVGRGRRDAALAEEDEDGKKKKKEEITRLMCFACQTRRLNSTV